MRIGITFDLKNEGLAAPGQPDDLQEEFDSPRTVEAIAAVLSKLGHHVEQLGDGPPLLRRLLSDPPDIVFNFAEGQGVGRSREARVPAVLEMLGIPYTGSDPLTLAVTLDKALAKTIVAAGGVPTPWGVVIAQEDVRASGGVDRHLAALGLCESPSAAPLPGRFPLIAKPAWEGSSKGIRQKCLVRTPAELPGLLDQLLGDYRQPILVEEYLAGEEVTVGILGNSPPSILGVMRVVPRSPTEHFIYGLEVKRDYRNRVEYECPPRLPQPIIAQTEAAALAAYRALGCRDVARVDFRIRDGIPYFLEVNPLPGLNPDDSDMVIMARLAGWSYDRLVGSIFQSALDRLGLHAEPAGKSLLPAN